MEISSWYPFSPNILQRLKKMSKTIKNLEICWKIPQNWEKIWEISSWYPYSHYTAKNTKKCQKLGKKIKFIQKILQIFFGKFFFKIFHNKCQNWPPHGLVMKNDISHAGNMLKCDFPVFTGFCRIFRCKIWKKNFCLSS